MSCILLLIIDDAWESVEGKIYTPDSQLKYVRIVKISVQGLKKSASILSTFGSETDDINV